MFSFRPGHDPVLYISDALDLPERDNSETQELTSREDSHSFTSALPHSPGEEAKRKKKEAAK